MSRREVHLEAGAPAGVRISTLGADRLPLVLEPAVGGVDLDAWAREHRGWLQERLDGLGALLFRGFGAFDAARFDGLTRAIASDFPEFPEESSPRTPVLGVIQTSTDYPAEYPIQFHTEYSYGHAWPMKLFFCCAVPPAGGGETPIADTRGVLRRLSDATRGRFAERRVLYQRNYVPSLGVSWQKAFRTDDPAVLETLCRKLGIEHEWSRDGALRTRQVSDAIVRHPRTGEAVWFNHAFFFNARALEPLELREFMLGEPEEDLSTQTYYGDGSPIAPETIEEIRSAYAAEAVAFPWQVGDVLLIDNMATAHSRRPYTGARRILASMADGCTREDLAAAPEGTDAAETAGTRP